MACLFDELQANQQVLEQTAYKVYAKVVRETLYEVAQENCHGCQIDHPSQKQHDVCLFMSLEEKLDYFLDEALERVDLERATEKWNKALKEFFLPKQRLILPSTITRAPILNLIARNLLTILLSLKMQQNGTDDL